MAERLTEIVHPATLAQVSSFHLLGLRAGGLSLPVMRGLVLGLLWRQIGGVAELVRVVPRETRLWVPPRRDLTPPARRAVRAGAQHPLGRGARALAGPPRPLPPLIAWAQARFTAVLIAEGSTVDVWLRQIGRRRDAVEARHWPGGI